MYMPIEQTAKPFKIIKCLILSIATLSTQKLLNFHQLELGPNTNILTDYACLNTIQLTAILNPVVQSLTAQTRV